MALTSFLRSLLDFWRPVPVQQKSSNNQPDPINDTGSHPMHYYSQCKSNSQTRGSIQQHPSSSPLSAEERMHMGTLPLKYAGYPAFTRYLASSREVVILRRFDQLHTRVLLKMQDDIVRQEEELRQIDEDHMIISKPNDVYHINGSFREDAGTNGRTPSPELLRRSIILDKLKKTIGQYDQMILNYRTLRADPEPSERYIENVRTYLYKLGHSTEPGRENHGPIWQQEADYIYKDGDLLELVPEVKAPLRSLIEKWTLFMLAPWFRARPRGTRLYQDFRDGDDIKYQSDAKIEGFITSLCLLLGLALLIGPLQLLDRVNNERVKLNIICGLIAAFLIVMALVMPARPWETLAATAAYSAVLMVFMQIQSAGNNADYSNQR